MGRPEIDFNQAKVSSVNSHLFVFVLLPGFSSLDLGAAVESLSAANATLDKPDFVWQIVSETGEPVKSSSGVTVAVDASLPPIRQRDYIVICAPLEEQLSASPKLKSWLRQEFRFGAQLCGLGGGAALLAHIGLAEGCRLSTHWKLQPALSELFPGLEAVCSVFESAPTIATCGGGVATLDLFSAIIGQKCGAVVASDVADQLLYSTVRAGDDRQTKSDLCRVGTRHGFRRKFL